MYPGKIWVCKSHSISIYVSIDYSWIRFIVVCLAAGFIKLDCLVLTVANFPGGVLYGCFRFNYLYIVTLCRTYSYI